MKTHGAILVVINSVKNKRLLTKTAIQKILYFLNIKGIINEEFISHYYGPYSQNVSNALLELVLENFVDEEEHFRYYSYSLTNDGVRFLNEAKAKHQNEIEKIERIVDICEKETGLNYKILSYAADRINGTKSNLKLTDEEIRKAEKLIESLKVM